MVYLKQGPCPHQARPPTTAASHRAQEAQSTARPAHQHSDLSEHRGMDKALLRHQSSLGHQVASSIASMFPFLGGFPFGRPGGAGPFGLFAGLSFDKAELLCRQRRAREDFEMHDREARSGSMFHAKTSRAGGRAPPVGTPRAREMGKPCMRVCGF